MPVLGKEFPDIQETIECGFTLKRVCDMIRTYSLKSNVDKLDINKLVPVPVDSSKLSNVVKMMLLNLSKKAVYD